MGETLINIAGSDVVVAEGGEVYLDRLYNQIQDIHHTKITIEEESWLGVLSNWYRHRPNDLKRLIHAHADSENPLNINCRSSSPTVDYDSVPDDLVELVDKLHECADEHYIWLNREEGVYR